MTALARSRELWQHSPMLSLDIAGLSIHLDNLLLSFLLLACLFQGVLLETRNEAIWPPTLRHPPEERRLLKVGLYLAMALLISLILFRAMWGIQVPIVAYLTALRHF